MGNKYRIEIGIGNDRRIFPFDKFVGLTPPGRYLVEKKERPATLEMMLFSNAGPLSALEAYKKSGKNPTKITVGNGMWYEGEMELVFYKEIFVKDVGICTNIIFILFPGYQFID